MHIFFKELYFTKSVYESCLFKQIYKKSKILGEQQIVICPKNASHPEFWSCM